MDIERKVQIIYQSLRLQLHSYNFSTVVPAPVSQIIFIIFCLQEDILNILHITRYWDFYDAINEIL